ncbi:MAG: hypothetical protein LBH93_02260, partial [Chitinispirillales bacterium]|nr:hypothetical protein [Chitinispirillales bacterium]
ARLSINNPSLGTQNNGQINYDATNISRASSFFPYLPRVRFNLMQFGGFIRALVYSYQLNP